MMDSRHSDLSDIVPENVQKLDSIKYISDLQRIGKAVVEKKVKIADFGQFLR